MSVSLMNHEEHHRSHRSGWLRAAVLGANDGIVSTASLIAGVAAADAGRTPVILAGVAGLVAGAMSMAAGEYVSVKSQADTEEADLKQEARELEEHPGQELVELAKIYEARGVQPDLAVQVARQMMEHDALGAHARDEIGITDALSAKPVQAALTSAVTFAAGALLPLLVAMFSPLPAILWLVPLSALLSLGLLGGAAAYTGGAPVGKAVARVIFWGLLAMALTAAAGHLLGIHL